MLQGVVNVGAVDMTEHQSVGAPYGIQGFPTIKIFGVNKQRPQDYQGIYSSYHFRFYTVLFNRIVYCSDPTLGCIRVFFNRLLAFSFVQPVVLDF